VGRYSRRRVQRRVWVYHAKRRLDHVTIRARMEVIRLLAPTMIVEVRFAGDLYGAFPVKGLSPGGWGSVLPSDVEPLL
jgi:hypothetical protein